MNIQPESKEWEFLLFACHLAIQNKSKTDLNAPSVEVINWDQLWLLASRHQVRPLLYRGIVKWDERDLVPSDFFEKLKAFNFRLAARNLGQVREMLRVLEIFRQHDIEAIPLKGAVLSEVAFGDPTCREFSDIDLLTRLKDQDRIKKILLNENYVAKVEVPDVLKNQYHKYNCEYNYEFFKNGRRLYHIEPHWFIGHKMLQIDVGINDLKELLYFKNIFSNENKILTPEGFLLTSCLHHIGKEDNYILKQVLDITALLNKYGETMNWEQLLNISKRLKTENLLLLGICISNRLFPIQLPHIINELVGNKKIISHAKRRLRVLGNEQMGDVESIPFFKRMKDHWSLRKRWGTKMRILYYHVLQIILPNSEDVKDKNITKLDYWFLCLKKPFRLWSKYK